MTKIHASLVAIACLATLSTADAASTFRNIARGITMTVSPLLRGCLPADTTEPPFYFVDKVDPYADVRSVTQSANNNRNYADKFYAEGEYAFVQDFRSRTVTRKFSLSSAEKNELRVMRNSLVLTDATQTELAKLSKGNGAAEVTLYSTAPATEVYDEFLNDFGKSILAKKGQKGFIPSSLLSAGSDDFVYVLAEDAPEIGLVRGDAISPFKEKSKYQKAICLLSIGEVSQYRFKIVRSKSAKLYSDFSMSMNGANLLQLTPVRKDVFARIADLEAAVGAYPIATNPWGMVQLPMDKNYYGPKSSYVHYRSQRVLPNLQEDTWGRPESVCQFMRVARDFRDDCLKNCSDSPALCDLRCITQVGDISWVTPGKSDARFGYRNARGYGNGKDPLVHSTHNTGTCFDLRPFRTAGEFAGLPAEKLATAKEKLSLSDGLTYGSGIYSRYMTRAFVRRASNNGAFPIFFNDTSLFTEEKDVKFYLRETIKDTVGNGQMRARYQSMPAHDNHLHICFDKDYYAWVGDSCKNLRKESGL